MVQGLHLLTGWGACSKVSLEKQGAGAHLAGPLVLADPLWPQCARAFLPAELPLGQGPQAMLVPISAPSPHLSCGLQAHPHSILKPRPGLGAG